MNRFRFLLIALGMAVLGIVLTRPVHATIQTLQSQIGVDIIINVTPSPMPSGTGLVYVPQQAPAQSGQPVIASVALGRAVPSRGAFRAESLHFDSTAVAQAQVQNPLLVQAEVSPNPKATLLYSSPGSSVIINQVAGTTQQWTCVFEVTIDTSKAWTLEQGLSNDLASSFPGKDVANNTYLMAATPKPTATPYVVYPDDGNEWSLTGTGSAFTTYCVTLTITIPGAVTQGTYSTNAIYSLYQ
jgi:hypothetical protein